jgi:hypothetical protein
MSSPVALALILLLSLPACASEPKGTTTDLPTSTSADVAPTATSSVRHAESSNPSANGDAVNLDVVQKVCSKAPCAGKFSNVVALRDDSGKIVRYRHEGDVSSCSDPPTHWFDTDGNDVGGIGLFPVVPGSDKAKELDKRRNELSAGGKDSERISCDGKITK